MLNKRFKRAYRVSAFILVLMLLINVMSLNILAYEANSYYQNQKSFNNILDYNNTSSDSSAKKVKEATVNDPFALMYDSNDKFAKKASVLIDNYYDYVSSETNNESRSETSKSLKESSTKTKNGEKSNKDDRENAKLLAKTGAIDDIQKLNIPEDLKGKINKAFDDTRETRYIIKYKTEKTAGLSDILTKDSVNIKSSKNVRKGCTELLVLNEKTNPKEFANKLKALGAEKDIEYIQPDFKMQISAIDGESEFDIFENEGYSLNFASKNFVSNIVTNTNALVNSISTANTYVNSPTVTIAIIDTGIDITHTGLASKIWRNTNEIANDGIDNDGNGYIDDVTGWNFYDHNNSVNGTYSINGSVTMLIAHGTHIAGIVATESADYNVRIMPLKVFGESGAYTSDIIDAIKYAEANGAKIVNCSFGSTDNNPALKEAITESEMLFVCSVGNARSNLETTPIYPACFGLDNIISVTSTNADGGLSYYSNYSPSVVDIAALGRDVDSTLPGNTYGKQSGTSMSAAQVSGAAATLLYVKNTQSAAELKARLINTADKLSNLQATVRDGRRLNLTDAINNTEQMQVKQNTPTDDFDVKGYNPTQDELNRLFSNSGDVIQFSSSGSSTFALKENGTVWAWGYNNYGALGNGTEPNRSSPVQVIGLTEVTGISDGCAVKSDGTVWAWGLFSYSDDEVDYSYVPVQVSGLTDIISVSRGYCSILALKSDGTVWRWGNGITSQISGLSGVVGISAGINFFLALKSDGTVWAWGENSFGQLGNGTYTSSNTPVKVSGLTGAVSIGVGLYHSLALKTDGTVWVWGRNDAGQLGDGTMNTSTTPKQVSGLTGVTGISAGGKFNLALKSDGTVQAWGAGSNGQIGDGARTYRTTPVQVSELTNIVGIEAGSENALAIKSDCSLWGWGSNTSGQLGNGTTVSSNTPTRICTSFSLTNGLNYPRKKLAVTEANEKLFAIGGSASSVSGAMEQYDYISDTWTVKQPMNTPREGLGAAPYGGKVYAIGGNNSNSYFNVVEAYDITTNIWATKAAMPTSRTNLGVVEVNGKIYAIGGYNGTSYLCTVEEYDPVTDTWSTKSNMPTPRSEVGIIEVNGIIYAVGGRNSNGALTTVETYDPISNQWSAATSLQYASDVGGVASYEGKIIFVGWEIRPDDYDSYYYVNRSEAYDISTKTWSYISGVQIPRAYFGMTTVAGSLYLVGGINNNDGYISKPEIYNIGTTTWNVMQPLPTGRTNLSTTSLDGKIYALGGYLTNSYKNNAEYYDSSDNTWHVIAGLNYARKDLGVATVKGKIYAIGGTDNTGSLQCVEEYTPGASAWTIKSNMPTARNSFGMETVNDKIYIIGGNIGSSYLSSVYEYNPENSTWDTSSKTSMPSARCDFGAIAANGKIYVIGGFDGTTCVNTLYIYDPVTNLWSAAANMPTARRALKAVAINGKIYAIGGYNGSAKYNIVEAYDPASNTWSSEAGIPNFNYSFGTETLNGKIFIIGGDPYLNNNKVFAGNFGDGSINALSALIHLGKKEVNPSGNLSRAYTDLSIQSPGFQINLSRTYNSGEDRADGPFGKGWSFGFQGKVTINGNRVIVRLPNGSALTFEYDVDEGCFIAKDSRAKLGMTYDSGYTLITKDQYSYSFNNYGWLTKMTDRNGNCINLTLDNASTGLVTQIKYLTDKIINITYNDQNHITSITDPLGRVVTYDYNVGDVLSCVHNPMGKTTSYEYDAYSYLNKVTDNDSNIIESFLYDNSSSDGRARISSATDTYNNTTSYTYDSSYRIVTSTDQNGRQIITWFDKTLYPVMKQDPEGRRTLTVYSNDTDGVNRFGEALSETDRNGNRTVYERDANGNITKKYNPDSSCQEFTYDSKNNLIKQKDEDGKYTFYVYDSSGMFLMKKARPLDGTSQYSGNDTGFAVTTYSYYSDLEATQLGYHGKGLLHTEKDPAENITTYTYDADGNATSVTNGAGKVTTYTYNAIGWKTSETSPKGYRKNYVYDNCGRLEKTTLSGEEVTRIVYDNLGRKIKEIPANLYVSSQDDLTNHTYSGDCGYRYTYYTSGKVHTITDPCGNVTSYTYDYYGNIATETKPSGAIYLYYYDQLNRITSKSFKSSSTETDYAIESYSYSILTNGNTQTSKTKHYDASNSATTTTTYDYAKRAVRIDQADGAYTVNNYNLNGTLASSLDARGNTTYYSYDGLNRLIKQWNPVVLGSYTYKGTEYDNAGRVTKQIQGKNAVANGITPTTNLVWTSITYNGDGTVQQKLSSGGAKTVYEYDDDGNPSGQKDYYDSTNYSYTTYVYNHLNKATSKNLFVQKRDISGEDNSNESLSLTTTYDYDANGNVKTVTDPNSTTITYTYDAMNRQLTASQPGLDENNAAAVITTYKTYNWDGKVNTSKNERGHETLYSYDVRGLLTSVTNALGAVQFYAYDNAGRLIAEVSPKNYSSQLTLSNMSRTEYTYDGMDRVLRVTQNYYDTVTTSWKSFVSKACTYDGNGNITKKQDALGNQSNYGSVYAYDFSNRVTTETDPLNNVKSYGYDGLGRVASQTDANQHTTSYIYNDDGKVLSKSVAGILVQSNEYDLKGNLKKSTDGNGNETNYTYNDLNQPRSLTTSGDSTINALAITYRYTKLGQLAEQTDSTGRQTLLTYDKQGHKLTQTERKSDGTQPITLYYHYDVAGNLCSQTDGNGNLYSYTYDALNRKTTSSISVTDVTAATTVQITTYEYDTNGNKTSEQNWRGNKKTYTYDALNRLIERKDPNNVIVEKLVYNNNNAQISSTDALNNVTQFVYDRNSRLTQTIDWLNHTQSQSYDGAGNIATKTDGNENVTYYSYDGLNRLSSVTNALNQVTSYTYDACNNLLTQTDGKGNITTYKYNARNLPIKRIDAGGILQDQSIDSTKAESYTYFADGNLATSTDRNGLATSYVYDIHGRTLTKTTGTKDVTYTYDNNGNQLTVADDSATITRTYDQLNRNTSKTVSGIGTSTFQYDVITGMATGNTAVVTTDPKENINTKVYDPAGKLIQVIVGANTTTFAYFDNGNKQSVTYPNGVTEEYTYYADNRLHTLSNKRGSTTLEAYTYTYDNNGNMASKIDIKGTTSYTYDVLNRLHDVTEPSGKVTIYTYDAAGNRSGQSVTASGATQNTNYTYNAQNRLSSTEEILSASISHVTDYFYDNNGNTVTKRVASLQDASTTTQAPYLSQVGSYSSSNDAMYTYDVYNRLTSASQGLYKVGATYNAEGLRVTKTSSTWNGQSVTTQFVYEADKVVLELDISGNQTAYNVYGGNTLLSRTVDGQTLYYIYNGHGDVTGLTDASGNVVQSYYYDAFGNVLEQSGSSSNTVKYSGYQHDMETGLFYVSSRYYDPVNSRMLSEDTYRGDITDPLSLNLYVYCKNNPLIYYDPTGHEEANVRDLVDATGNAQDRSGKSVETLIAYDPGQDVAIVQVNGVTKYLTTDGHSVNANGTMVETIKTKLSDTNHFVMDNNDFNKTFTDVVPNSTVQIDQNTTRSKSSVVNTTIDSTDNRISASVSTIYTTTTTTESGTTESHTTSTRSYSGGSAVNTLKASDKPINGEAIQAEFQKVPNGDYDGAAGLQCVDLTRWYVDTYTTLTSTSGDGYKLVSNIASDNNLQTSTTPRANSIFSIGPGATGLGYGGSSEGGHTGIVLSVDEKNHKVKILHTWNGYKGDEIRSGIIEVTYPEEGATYLYLGDYMKK